MQGYSCPILDEVSIQYKINMIETINPSHQITFERDLMNLC